MSELNQKEVNEQMYLFVKRWLDDLPFEESKKIPFMAIGYCLARLSKQDELLKEQEAVVRCKDCKHRPKKPDWETYEDGGDIEFPDDKCPCQCLSDRYYSWYPNDDWFCADGERR